MVSSPAKLQIRFEMAGDELTIYRPDGRKFLTTVELAQRAIAAEQKPMRLKNGPPLLKPC